MKKESWIKLVAVLTSIVTLWACSKNQLGDEPGNTEGFSKDRKEFLQNLSDNIIIPSYDRYQTRLNTYNAELDSFAAAPSLSRLSALRAAWVAAYTEWQRVELFDIGPGEDHALRFFCNIYPTNTSTIAANINNPSASLEFPSSYTAQGFPAIDYLINGIADTDQEIINLYTTDADAPKRMAYLQRLSNRMSDLLATVISEWKGDFKNTFIEKTALDINSSTSLLINGLSLHYERYLRSGKIGIPAGAMMNGIVAPAKVEAYYKRDISGVLAKTAHQAFVDMFNGRHAVTGIEGPSIRSYLDAIGAKDLGTQVMLSKTLNDQFSVCQNNLQSLNGNYHDQINSNNDVMKAAFSELQKSVLLIKVDLPSAMSVTITYTDNDGD